MKHIIISILVLVSFIVIITGRKYWSIYEIIQTLLLIYTAVIVFWYAYLTNQLRIEAKEANGQAKQANEMLAHQLQLEKQSKEEESESRRAYLAPCEYAGHFKITELLEDEPVLSMSLENYGINPASRIEGLILCFNEVDVDGTNKNPKPVLSLSIQNINPVPHNSRVNVRIKNQQFNNLGIDDLTILMSNYLICKVTYYDKILGKEFNDSFFWHVGGEGKLAEIQQHFERIKELSKSFSKGKEENAT